MGQSDVYRVWRKAFRDARPRFEVIAIISKVYETGRKLLSCLDPSKSIALAMSPLAGENPLPGKLIARLTVIGRRSPRFVIVVSSRCF